jgi:hypothetical protein
MGGREREKVGGREENALFSGSKIFVNNICHGKTTLTNGSSAL